MKVIHITVGKVNPNGENGINRVVYNLNKSEITQGVDSQIWSFSSEVLKEEIFIRDEFVKVHLFPFISIFSRSNVIINKIKNERNSIDVVHFHTPWIKEKYFLSRLLKKLNIPYVITCHGLYDKTLIKTLKKSIAFAIYEKKILNQASFIRALTYEEKYNARIHGVISPIVISQNGIDVDELPVSRSNNFFLEKPYNNKIKLIWIGVLREYKNIDSLILSTVHLAESVKKQIQFVIVGPDANGNLSKYKDICNKYKCLDMFDFTGPLYGQDKYDAIESSDIYIMPSKIDEISLAVMDAMACGKPCILTRQCHVSYFVKNNFFEMCEPFPEDIAQSISLMISKRDQWGEMGANGKQLIDNYFSWRVSVKSLIKEYENVIRTGRLLT